MANTKDNQQLKKRVVNEQQTISRITNKGLDCFDCVLRYDDSEIFGNTSKCEMFPNCKPDKVLLGGKCNEKVQE